MSNILVDIGIGIFSIVVLVGGVIFIVYLYFNEKKLKETRSIQDLKKMYKGAIYVSLSFIIVGTIIYVSGIYTAGSITGGVTYLGGSISGAGLLAIVYSSIGYYNISHGKQQKQK